MNNLIKLSPSDFKYLYEDCKHCYYQKAKGIIKVLPSIGMPGVFTKMNSLLQNAIKFFTQLHAYKFALENPSFGEPKKVSKMGVIAISPEEISFPGEDVIFKAKPQWFEIETDMDRFYAFISEVSKLLNGPAPTENPDKCKWCFYRICTQKQISNQNDIPF